MSPRLRFTVAVLPMLAAVAVAQTQTPFKKDQKIEVREGDVWSAATVVEQEGRRVHVKYDDGGDEWVPLARVRTPGAAAGGATADKPDAKSADKPAETPKEKLPASGRCEVKSALSWRPATIKNRDGDLYLVIYDKFDNKIFWEWVSSDCVRAIGSDKEGPHWGQGAKVGSGSIEQAKAEAKKQLPKWKQDYKAEQEEKTAEANGEKRSAFDPKPYDKPVATPLNADVAEQQARRTVPNTYTPDAVVATSVDSIALAKGERGFGRGSDVLNAGKFAAAVTSTGHDLYAVQIVNLAAGSATPAIDFDPLSRPFAVSADGKLLVGRSDNFFGGTKLRLDFFDVTPAGLKHRVSFQPYIKAKDANDRDVTFVAVVDGVVVTGNRDGDLAGWTLSPGGPGDATVTCKWKTVVGGKAVALSPNGKTIAAARADGLFLIDPATGATQAFIPGTREPDRIAFTPDGKRVVGIAGPVLVAYDLAAGTAAPDVGLPPGVFGRAIVGVAPGQVLLDNAYLFDLDRHAVTWKYDNAADAFAACGRTWARVDGNRAMLVPAKLPDAAATRAAVAAAEPLFKAGDSVTLDIAIEADATQQAAVREHFTKELQRIGVTVADGQPTKLVVRTENGKSTQEKWERMGGAPWNRDSADVTITDKISSVMFENSGKMAWQTMTTSRVGGMVSSRPGQGIAESVAAANQFNVGFFRSVTLPTFVPKPRTPLVAGSTNWTAVGNGK